MSQQSGSPCYLIAKELTKILIPLVGQTDTNIKNSAYFVQLVQNIEIHDKDLLVSFDVNSLFTKVPVDETLKTIAKKLEEDEALEERTTLSTRSICQLVELCLKCMFFHQNSRIWEQKDGVAMGSPLSPIVANIFMESFEQEALQLAKDKPRLWVHYVDDTFLI